MPYFDGFFTQESLLLILFLTISFLIGFVTGRIAGFRQSHQLRRERDAAVLDTQAMQLELNGVSERYGVREADIKRQSLEIERLQRAAHETDIKKGQLADELETLQMSSTTWKQGETKLEQRIDDLETNIQVLQRSLKAANQQTEHAEQATEELRKQIGNIDEAALVQLQQDVNSLRYVNTLLEQERDDLQRTLSETSNSLETMLQRKEKDEVKRVYVIGKPGKGEKEITLTQKEAATRLQAMIGEYIPYASPNEKDDFKLIGGIGQFIEEKLHGVGIYTYEQMSMFDDEFINVLTAAIGFFPDRIKRGRWVEQAKELWEEKEQAKLTLPHRDSDGELA